MAISPSQISFRYKKYLSAPSVRVTITPSQQADSMSVQNKPAWLNVVYQGPSTDGLSHDFQVGINPTAANNLAAGNYNGTVSFNTVRNGGLTKPLRDDMLEVAAEIIENIVLSLSKTDYSFNYTLGGTAPASQPLAITTENPWSIVADQNWVTFSKANGVGSDNLNIGVAVAGLAVGVHEATFQVDDGQNIKQGTVKLVITGSDESGDHLNVSRTTLSFSEIFQQAPTRSASVTIETSLQANVTTAASWLQLSAASFAAGTHSLMISVINTAGMAVGNYSSSIQVESGYATRTIGVLLRIVQVQSSGIESGELYFAGDRNTLLLTSSIPNAEAHIDFKTPNLEYSRRVPFFSDLAQVIIGLETSNLLKPALLPAVLQSGAFIPVTPLSYDFTVYDKELGSTVITERASFTQVRFLNGKSPGQTDVLTKIPPRIATPYNGIVCLSFISPVPVTEIGLSGDHTGSIAVGGVSGTVYSAVVDLSPFNLKVGNSVTITVGPVTVEVVIKPKDLETSRLIWLNEWDCPEVMTLDGGVDIYEEEDSTVVTVARDGKDLDRVIEIKEPKSFRVGTGNIYSDAEVRWLASIIRSKKIWLEFDGVRTEVIRKFNSLPVYRSRENIRNFNLTFDSAER